LYNWDGTSVRQGSSSYGDILFNFEGKNVRRGSGTSGNIICNVEGKVPIAILIFIVE